MNLNYISVLIPSYNCAEYLPKLLDSILNQSYDFIETIIIDDGSTDKTKDIVIKYDTLFKKRKYKFKYIYQNNQGQSSAINNGLKIITGEYLTWPDADDYYIDSDAFKKMMTALKDNPDAGICYSYANLFNGKNIVGKLQYKNNHIFYDAIFGKNGFYFQPICYMAKVSKLFERIPDKNIYIEKNAGQNWQLMLPLFYDTQCVCIPYTLSNILVRKNSHSRGTYSTVEKKAILLNAYYNTLSNTILRISMPFQEKEVLLNDITKYYKGLLLNHYWHTKSFKLFRSTYKKTVCLHTAKNKWNYIVSFIPFLRHIQLSDDRIKKLLKK